MRSRERLKEEGRIMNWEGREINCGMRIAESGGEKGASRN
jgi:hypothetical protein